MVDRVVHKLKGNGALFMLTQECICEESIPDMLSTNRMGKLEVRECKGDVVGA